MRVNDSQTYYRRRKTIIVCNNNIITVQLESTLNFKIDDFG